MPVGTLAYLVAELLATRRARVAITTQRPPPASLLFSHQASSRSDTHRPSAAAFACTHLGLTVSEQRIAECDQIPAVVDILFHSSLHLRGRRCKVFITIVHCSWRRAMIMHAMNRWLKIIHGHGRTQCEESRPSHTRSFCVWPQSRTFLANSDGFCSVVDQGFLEPGMFQSLLCTNSILWIINKDLSK